MSHQGNLENVWLVSGHPDHSMDPGDSNMEPSGLNKGTNCLSFNGWTSDGPMDYVTPDSHPQISRQATPEPTAQQIPGLTPQPSSVLRADGVSLFMRDIDRIANMLSLAVQKKRKVWIWRWWTETTKEENSRGRCLAQFTQGNERPSSRHGAKSEPNDENCSSSAKDFCALIIYWPHDILMNKYQAEKDTQIGLLTRQLTTKVHTSARPEQAEIDCK